MRILHTADWHLNSRLGRQPRNPDLARALNRIALYLEEERVDVMLVAGDLFRERSHAEQLQAGVEIIKTAFKPFIERGGTIVAICGNHDSEVFFATLRDALDLVMPTGQRGDGLHSTGRLYLAPKARLLRLADRDGQVVQFVLMPYPSSSYLRGEAVQRFETLAQRNRAIAEQFRTLLARLQQELEPRWPSVLVSHILIRGMLAPTGYYLEESDEVRLEASDLSFPWSYVALGHMHRPQEVLPNAAHMRYAGSIERLDYGERNDQKSVVLLEIKEGRLVEPPRLLPLESTPFYEVEIRDPAQEIPTLTARYPEHERALVRYILHWDSSTMSLSERERCCQAIEELFPRWYEREIRDLRSGPITSSGLAFQQSRDVPGTVRHYLNLQLKDDPEREALLQLAEQLLMEEEAR
jgi:exonuclease SbcD